MPATLSTAQAISDALDIILRHEGGFVCDPHDPGGATNMGITIATYQSIHPDATVADLKAMSVSEARSIYLARYIQGPRIDRLPPEIIANVADAAVNCGVKEAGELLQAALMADDFNVTVDGIIGPGTIASAQAAVARYGTTFNNTISDARDSFYRNLVNHRPASAEFLTGWLRRSDSFRVAEIPQVA